MTSSGKNSIDVKDFRRLEVIVAATLYKMTKASG